MDTRWLSAPEEEVEAEGATLDPAVRQQMAPKSQVLLVLNLLLLGIYFGVVWLVFAGRVDASAQPQIEPNAIRDHAVAMSVFGLWCYGSIRFSRWRRRRSDPVPAWRQHLTALANGLDPEPVRRATFASLITGERRTASCLPRFVGPGFEFGNLKERRHTSLEWHYLAVSLPAPLPQLFLEATGAGPLTLELPRPVEGQRLTVGGQLDRRFTVYAPPGYGLDAMYVLTPVVIAALIDHADRYHVEVTGDTLVFFSPVLADFTEQEPWLAVDAVLQEVVPAVVRQAERYRDERGPGQRSTLWWEPRRMSGSQIRESAGHLLVHALLVCTTAFAFLGLVLGGEALLVALFAS